MDLEIGSILTGKVTGITKFGAFVALPNGKSGLVHISEIANTYINDIHEHLATGQEVNVKVIGIDDAGRINLSIKQTLPTQPRRTPAPQPAKAVRPAAPQPAPQPEPAAEPSFEDKLKRFMRDSDSKISGLYAERKNSRRRGSR